MSSMARRRTEQGDSMLAGARTSARQRQANRRTAQTRTPVLIQTFGAELIVSLPSAACPANRLYRMTGRPHEVSRSADGLGPMPQIVSHADRPECFSEREPSRCWLRPSENLPGQDACRKCRPDVHYLARLLDADHAAARAAASTFVDTRPIPGWERTVLGVGVIRFWRDPLRIAETRRDASGATRTTRG